MREIHEAWKELMEIYKEAEQYNVPEYTRESENVIKFDSSVAHVAMV